jgi:hypothetical protein
MTDIPDDELLAMLQDSERLPEILRDDEFWHSLELLPPSNRSEAVEKRFSRAMPADEMSPLFIERWARLGACVAELIKRHGPSQARLRLQPKKH